MIIVFFLTDDSLHFIAAVFLHSLHVCRCGQMLENQTRHQFVSKCWAGGDDRPPSSERIDIHLDQTQCIQTEVEISKEEERRRRVAGI